MYLRGGVQVRCSVNASGEVALRYFGMGGKGGGSRQEQHVMKQSLVKKLDSCDIWCERVIS
jgi:hypothetical protein